MIQVIGRLSPPTHVSIARFPVNGSSSPSQTASHDQSQSGSLIHHRMELSFTTSRRFYRCTGSPPMSTHTTAAILPVTRAQAAEYMLLFANRRAYLRQS